MERAVEEFDQVCNQRVGVHQTMSKPNSKQKENVGGGLEGGRGEAHGCMVTNYGMWCGQ